MPFPATMGDTSRGMRGRQGQSRGPFGGQVEVQGQGGYGALPKPKLPRPATPEPGNTGPQFLGPGGGMNFGPTQVRPQNTGIRPNARLMAIRQMLEGRRF